MAPQRPRSIRSAFDTVITDAAEALEEHPGGRDDLKEKKPLISLTREEIRQCTLEKKAIITMIRERMQRLASYVPASDDAVRTPPDFLREVAYEIPIWLRLADYRKYAEFVRANGCDTPLTTPGIFQTSNWIRKGLAHLLEKKVQQGHWIVPKKSSSHNGVYKVLRITSNCEVVLGQKTGNAIVLVGTIGASYVGRIVAEPTEMSVNDTTEEESDLESPEGD